MVNKEEESMVDSGRSNFEARQDDEINLYDYWKVLVKRKKILIGIFLVPLVVVTIISLSLPRYYRGESEMTIPALPAPNIASVITAPNIVKLIGNIDDTQKVKIFTNNPGAIKNVSVSLPKKSTDKVNIIIDAKTADIIPQAFKDIHSYISMLPGIKEEIASKKEETDLKINKLIEARKANLLFLNQITDMMKKRQISFINVNPSDLIKKDADLSLEIMNLQSVNMTAGTLAPPSITKQPTNSRIKQIIMITGFLSLFAGIFIVFFLEYINRMKAREK
jgi:hypothetical protein